MRNFCVRVASHRRVPASRKSLHSLDAEFPEGSLPDQRQSDGIFDKAIFWFVHSAAAMGVWSSDYGIARAIVDRKINNPLSRKTSQSETEEFSRPNSVVKRPPPLTAPPPTRLLHPLFSSMPPPPDAKATPVHYTLQRHIHAYRRIRTRATRANKLRAKGTFDAIFARVFARYVHEVMNASTETAPDIRVVVPLRDFLVRTFAPFRINQSCMTEERRKTRAVRVDTVVLHVEERADRVNEYDVMKSTAKEENIGAQEENESRDERSAGAYTPAGRNRVKLLPRINFARRCGCGNKADTAVRAAKISLPTNSLLYS
ncbi:hypothetical protein ALC53_05303 [Atta colombica]|uniref:Uncharacterized protein n=1 Tax=Atta colombica TaxID=520822 RepID=A0A195BJE1_9HYME|nr:hypothetical protein ALC53_05303 [Atta colombica]